MGFFSWITQDTDVSIANVYSPRKTFPVTMIDDKGNQWREEKYEGYGEFGGKDYYELLAEMNGLPANRKRGIELVFKDNSSGDHTEGVKYPNLVEHPDDWVYDPSGPKSCGEQGFFYADDDDNDDTDFDNE